MAWYSVKHRDNFTFPLSIQCNYYFVWKSDRIFFPQKRPIVQMTLNTCTSAAWVSSR